MPATVTRRKRPLRYHDPEDATRAAEHLSLESYALPKDTQILKLLLEDCSRKIAALGEVVTRDSDRLSLFCDSAKGAVSVERLAERSRKLTDAFDIPPACVFDMSASLSPYLDGELLGLIHEKRSNGLNQVQLAIDERKSGKAWLNNLISAYRFFVSANRALLMMLQRLQQRIIHTIECGRADAKTDAPRKIKKPGARQGVHMQLCQLLMQEAGLGRSEVEIAEDFAVQHSLKQRPQSLLRGVRRIRESFAD